MWDAVKDSAVKDSAVKGKWLRGAPMMAGWRVEVIRERCLSTANCVATAPGFFALDSDGIAMVTGEVAEGGEAAESVRNAVAECPAAALRIRPLPSGSAP